MSWRRPLALASISRLSACVLLFGAPWRRSHLRAGDRPAVGVKQAADTMSIAFTGATEPVVSQFVVRQLPPVGNMTRLTPRDTQVTGEQLRLLMGVLPELSRIAILSNPNARPHHLCLSATVPHVRWRYALKCSRRAALLPASAPRSSTSARRRITGDLLIATDRPRRFRNGRGASARRFRRSRGGGACAPVCWRSRGSLTLRPCSAPECVRPR